MGSLTGEAGGRVGSLKVERVGSLTDEALCRRRLPHALNKFMFMESSKFIFTFD